MPDYLSLLSREALYAVGVACRGPAKLSEVTLLVLAWLAGSNAAAAGRPAPPRPAGV